MRNYVVSILWLTALIGVSGNATAKSVNPPRVKILGDETPRFCESTLWQEDKLLVANFGTTELNPLNELGQGYISAIDDHGKTTVFIARDGYLSAPKGMAIANGRLYIADVNRVVIYDLADLKLKPQTIRFPEMERFVNDIVKLDDGDLLISVTNTGHIFRLSGDQLSVLGSVPGANGLAVKDGALYVASYNPNETPDAENVIYRVDLPGFKVQKLIEGLAPGQYDGIAFNGEKLYFSSWGRDNKNNGKIHCYNLGNKKLETLNLKNITLGGPADISISNQGVLYIPDLKESRVLEVKL